MKNKNLDIKYVNGKELYGDNFTQEEIEKWYKEEAEAYSDLGSKNKNEYIYKYHNSNELNGYKHLSPTIRFKNVLGIGSAYGEEFLPIIHQIDKLTILEPSDNLKSDKLGEIIPTYAKPNINGSIDFDDNTFDLITCFGVLHHIPNVTFVLNELIRVLTPGGYLLFKEPISSMGDWRYTRPGLTKNERGVPDKLFDDILKNNNVEIVSKTFIDSLFFHKILNKIFKFEMDSKLYIRCDRLISSLLSWNSHYHRVHNYQKIAPGGVFYVIKKRNDDIQFQKAF
jgi:SAM-dependent methyltransferase